MPQFLLEPGRGQLKEKKMLKMNDGFTVQELKAFLAVKLSECLEDDRNSTYNGNYRNNNSTNITTEAGELKSTSSNDTAWKNETTFPKEIYCSRIYDGYLCWPDTPAGTVVTKNCPDFVVGFNENLLAHKTCLANGSWYTHPDTNEEWSNYTGCVDYKDLEFRRFVNELYIKGYSISLVTLLLSLVIFLGFRSLRCTRIRIHVHLFTSLAFSCIAWILWYKLFVESPDNIRHSPMWCISLHLVLHYLMLCNYFWMFCEGLHLHLVLVVVFVKDNVVMRWFMAIGWLAPLLFLITYGLARSYHPTDSTHCWMEDSELMWLLTIPVCLSLIASFIFLINVVRVLVKKLHPCSAQPAPLAIRKAARATIILVPLFGLQHILLPFRPDTGSSLEGVYQIASAVLVSLQGVCVSCLFCFANHDVIFAVRCVLSRLLPGIVAPVPGSTNTGPLATQSRDIGV